VDGKDALSEWDGVLLHLGLPPIWSNINLPAYEYEVEEEGSYPQNMSPGIIETIARSERGSVYSHYGHYPFSPSLATRLFCPAHVGKKPTPYLQRVLSFKNTNFCVFYSTPSVILLP